MNYYKRGDAANADRIKAAFEEKGYDIPYPDGCANPAALNIGVEIDGAKFVVAETLAYICYIIKTHPDYQELELPVEPKFKKGDKVILYGEEVDIISVDVVNQRYNIHTNNPIIGYELLFKDQDQAKLVEPQPRFNVGDLVVWRNMLGRIEMVKQKDDGYIYRVGNCWTWEEYITLADHRDEVRILRSPGVC
jgi:hypothetical protein